MNQVELAEQIAREVHKGQKRTIGRREDYIKHPERVASHFSTNNSKIIAWLHDVLEDSNLTREDLEKKGISKELVDVVVIITKKKDEDYLNYILRVKRNEQARIIKIVDIRDNLERLNKGSLRDKYLLALHILEEIKNE
jgi:(p)ppGpp synthase/HD superfamily hydrolase